MLIAVSGADSATPHRISHRDPVAPGGIPVGLDALLARLCDPVVPELVEHLPGYKVWSFLFAKLRPVDRKEAVCWQARAALLCLLVFWVLCNVSCVLCSIAFAMRSHCVRISLLAPPDLGALAGLAGLLASPGDFLICPMVCPSGFSANEELLQNDRNAVGMRSHPNQACDLAGLQRQRGLVKVVPIEHASIGQVFKIGKVLSVAFVVANIELVVVHRYLTSSVVITKESAAGR